MEVILIGGGAAVLAGSTRKTRDVDFEARVDATPLPEDVDLLAAAIDQAMADSGVAAQFTENLAEWSELGLPPHRIRLRLWRRFGRIAVRLLDPAIYVVTKLRRGLTRDFDDLTFVARAEHVPWPRVARACGNAVRLSGASTRRTPFINRVKYLFRNRGREIWGPRFDAEPAVALFQRTSRRPGPAPSRGR